MRLLVQRVKEAKVEVEDKVVGEIGKGFLVLCGITYEDTEKEADYLAKKLCQLRVFEDEDEKMNLSINDVAGDLLLVSQFTLYADCTSGNRPSFAEAARPEQANQLYEYLIKKCKEQKIKVEKGMFGANMQVSLVNDGPVTILLEKNHSQGNRS